jgi:hypothetical protein
MNEEHLVTLFMASGPLLLCFVWAVCVPLLPKE